MLVLSRRNQESVVIGGASGFEQLFKVKVADVRTANQVGKLRRRGRFSGYRSDWKKAYVTLKAGQKIPEYAEI